MNDHISVKKVMAFGFLKLVVEYREKKYAIVRRLRCSGDLNQITPAAPPYVTKTLPTTWPFNLTEQDLVQRTQKIRVASASQFEELRKRMMALCHQLGFESFDLHLLSHESLSHFVSRRSGILGIPIIFEVRAEMDFPLHALADPFGRRGFIFVPLESNIEGDGTLPMYSNVVNMLQGWGQTQPTAAISDVNFVVRYEGFVCSLDMSGYGSLLNTTEGSVAGKKADIQNAIRGEVFRLTSRFLWRLGLPPHRMTGDGALFCLPSNNVSLDNLNTAYLNEVCKPLAGWNDMIRNGQASGREAGSRLVMLQGEFYCGRIAGADSATSEIDGQSLIDIIRLDTGFREHISLKTPHDKAKHFLVGPVHLIQEAFHANSTIKVFQYQTKENAYLNAAYISIIG